MTSHHRLPPILQALQPWSLPKKADQSAVVAVMEGNIVCSNNRCLGAVVHDSKASRLTWNLKQDVPYKVFVAGADSFSGIFSLDLAPDKSDQCSSAIDVMQIPYTAVGSIGHGMPVQDEAVQDKCSFVEHGDYGVWLNVTSQSGNCMTISTVSSEYFLDTVIAVFKGECHSPQCVAQNDNYAECQNCRSSKVTLNPHQAGVNYKILVTAKQRKAGQFAVQITEEDCDRCDNAITVQELPFNDYGDNRFSKTLEAIGDECFVIQKESTHGVWYRLDNLGSGKCMKASTAGSDLDTVLAVYEPTNHVRGCDLLQCLNSNNNIPDGTDENEPSRSEVFWKTEIGSTFPFLAPKDYFIMLGGYNGAQGRYNLTITEYDCLENDHCEGALFIQSSQGQASGTTFGSTVETMDARSCPYISETTRGLYHKVFGTGGCMAAEVGRSYPDSVSIYEGECGALQCVAYSHAGRGGFQHVAWFSELGKPYTILVAGFEDKVGDYNLTIKDCLDKDECIQPGKINVLPFLAFGNLTADNTIQYWYSGICPYFKGSLSQINNNFGEWHEMIGNGTCVTASTVGSALEDTVLAVFRGNDCDSLECEASNDDFADKEWQSQVSWFANKDDPYRIFVAGWGKESGEYLLNVTEKPCLANDDCDGAMTIDELPFQDAGDLTYATTEHSSAVACLNETFFEYGFDELYDSRGVWYAIDGNAATTFHAYLQQDDAIVSDQIVLAVFEGECGSLACVSTGFAGNVSWTSDAMSYKLLVVGQYGQVGPFYLVVDGA